jgi:D-glycero-alpha-D-manno-heptose-7-phosphate kinase
MSGSSAPAPQHDMSAPGAVSVPSLRPSRSPLRRAVASAPMRVSFAGGGTDLPSVARRSGGRVVGTAIDLRMRVVVEPFDRGWVRFESPHGGDGRAPAPVDAAARPARTFTRRCADPPRDDLAFRLLEAALAATGVDDGVAVRVETDMVPGAGLGGSASAAVATLLALRASVDDPAPPEELAREAVALERDRLRIACGGQDQVFAAFGGLLDLTFDDRGCSGIRPLPVGSPELVAALQAGLLLVDSQVRRVSGEVLDRIGVVSAGNTNGELVAAAEDVARGFAAGALDQVIAGMRRSAAAKLRRSASANAIALALQQKLDGLGVEVLRMCGAGGGGHILVWAPEARHGRILEALGPCVVRRPSLDAPGVRLDAT